MVQETLFVAKQLFELDEIPSTNNYAAQLLLSTKLSDGALISARYQTQGRGQRQSEWQSDKGLNLLLSYVFFPSFLVVRDQFLLSVTIANATAAFISEYTDNQVSIKWPNDIYIGNKKIAGILIENSLKGSQIVSTIMGVGINVNQTDFQNLSQATSLLLEGNPILSLSSLKNELSSKLEIAYLKLRAGNYQTLMDHFNARLYKKGEWVSFLIHEEKKRFKIIAVEKDGRILVMNENNQPERFDFGSCKLLIEGD